MYYIIIAKACKIVLNMSTNTVKVEHIHSHKIEASPFNPSTLGYFNHHKPLLFLYYWSQKDTFGMYV